MFMEKLNQLKILQQQKKLVKKYVPTKTTPNNIEIRDKNKCIQNINTYRILNYLLVDHIPNIKLKDTNVNHNLIMIKKKLIKIMKKFMTQIELILGIHKSFQSHF